MMLQKMVGMSDIIQTSFSQIKKMFKEHKEELIREISKERPRTSLSKENQPSVSKFKNAQPKQLKKETSDLNLKKTNTNLGKTQNLVGLNKERCHGKPS